MYRIQTAPLTVFLILTASPALAATSPSTSVPTEIVRGQSQAISTTETPRAAADRIYGPIRSEDPLVRAQIKRLYLDRHTSEEDAMTRLAELAEQLRAEMDADFRTEIRRDVAHVKQSLERRNIELGLEIARLNEDTARVADFERALNQLNNPEDDRPAVDPSILERRLREQGGSR